MYGGNLIRRLNGYAAGVIKEIIHEGETIFEIDGKKNFLSSIEDLQTTVKKDIEHD